jgi:hypothetical protein
MLPPGVNSTELMRKAKIRMEHTRKEILEMNDRISELIAGTFGSHSKHDGLTGKQRDEEFAKDKETSQERGSTTQKALDETTVASPEGYLGFEMPVKGTIVSLHSI